MSLRTGHGTLNGRVGPRVPRRRAGGRMTRGYLLSPAAQGYEYCDECSDAAVDIVDLPPTAARCSTIMVAHGTPLDTPADWAHNRPMVQR
jgi:hypothetical protein